MHRSRASPSQRRGQDSDGLTFTFVDPDGHAVTVDDQG